MRSPLRRRGGDKEKYRLSILERSPLSEVQLKDLKSHHITKFRDDRLTVVSAGTVLKDLGLLSAVINTGTTEWGLENVLIQSICVIQIRISLIENFI